MFGKILENQELQVWNQTSCFFFPPSVSNSCYHAKSYMHSVVCSCKHPRLEAVCPQSFQSDVCGCRLPPTQHKHESQVDLYLSELIHWNPHPIRPSVALFSVVTCALTASSLSSCKHPTLSCNQLSQRLREGCLLALAGNDAGTEDGAPAFTSRSNVTHMCFSGVKCSGFEQIKLLEELIFDSVLVSFTKG